MTCSSVFDCTLVTWCPDAGAHAVQVHYLSGPINVKDAEGKLAQPGDLLAVELCNLGPMPGQPLGLLQLRLSAT